MAKIKLICDSTSDLSEEMYEELGADVLRLKVNFGQDSFVDGKTIDIDRLYNLVEERKILPKTSACSIAEFQDVFAKYFSEGYQIIFVSISSEFSSNFNNALVAASTFEGHENDFRGLDSRSLSSGIGLQLFKIKEDIDQGFSLEEVYSRALDRVDRVNAEFVVDTMDYLYKGGRCSSLSYYVGNILSLHPIIRVEKGKMVVHKLSRGKLFKGMDFQIQELRAQVENDNVELDRVFVTHSKNEEGAKYIKEKLSSFIDSSKIVITEAGCIVSSHCGKGTIGILYITKNIVIGA
ncbi:MAG: DegV family protein [Bacilli bacterium]|nr:DegV family protein [Bacilli bacterium]